MPPPCHSANTPGVSGALATSDSMNGTLALLIDMVPPRERERHCTSRVADRDARLSSSRHRAAKRWIFSALDCGGAAAWGLQTIWYRQQTGIRGRHAVETEWRLVSCARADHRRHGERHHPAVRVQRR